LKIDNALSSTLKRLALYAQRTIGDGISNGTIKPEDERFFREKVEKFKYTDEGVTEFSIHGDYVTKPSWFRVAPRLTDSIEKSDEYSSALAQLTTVFGKSDMLANASRHFVGKLVHEYLHSSKFGEADIDSLIGVFLKDLRGEPVKYGAVVEIEGIVLRPDRVEPSYGVTLRRPKIEDLEEESPTFMYPFFPRFRPTPSAILTIEFLGREAQETQKKIEHSIALLRLFKSGSVKSTRYRMYSDSITDLMAHGVITSHRIEATLEKYLITEEDVSKLKKFWQTISEVMPPSFFELGLARIDHLTVAYNRYNDALFQDGVFERRVANAVMGLEALFLKSGETHELAYRLSLRTSKLLSSIGFDPHQVREIVSDAYKVRNIFAHGGHLGYKEKKRIDSKYKDIRNFLRPMLDYLRTSIVVMMLISKEKDEFIDLIDESFVDEKQEGILKGIVSGAADIVA